LKKPAWIIAALLLAGFAVVAWMLRGGTDPVAAVAPVATPAAFPTYVGSDACAACHAEAFSAWRGSQHAAAMQPATPGTVLATFEGTVLRGTDSEATLRRDGEAFIVRTAGPDGQPADFTVRYTFGLYPLQQYLVEFPRGRLQSLTLGWDSRPAAQGGQRWIDLYPGQDLRPGNPLHWTGIDQNWNYQCADCHSTDLRKGYDAETDRFDTTWSEVHVGCEACHGPGSAHVAWAGEGGSAVRDATANLGLVAQLDERRDISWPIDPATGNAKRSAPRGSSREIEVCARCHARRSQFSDDHAAGQPFHDAYRPALIEPGLYWPDGQQRDEVYNYGSFLTSRMAAAGVTCGDCHEPHGGALRAPGNAVCAQCHLAGQFDTPAHHHHEAGSGGGQCAACHMPTTTYMVVDPRHDHSFRIPRPDRSVALGVPNACNACHADRDAAWAAEAVRVWYGQPKPGFQYFAETFATADGGDARARASLIALAEDTAQPTLVRASALLRLTGDGRPDVVAAARKGLRDPDPNLRFTAVEAYAGAAPAVLARDLAPLLDDPIRLVRSSAARTLAGPAEAALEPGQRERFESALAEYIAGQRFNADRPEAHTSLGLLYAVRGDTAAAETEYRKSQAIDPSYVPAWVNLADLQRALGDEQASRATLLEGLDAAPGETSLRHALGLSLARTGDLPAALKELEAAARAAPQSARYTYVYAIALHSAGREQAALRELEQGLERHPANREFLLTLASIHLDAGRRDDALQYLAQAAQAYPGDPEITGMLQSLRGR
jgi:predicted CXXCH cytochrome family protein